MNTIYNFWNRYHVFPRTSGQLPPRKIAHPGNCRPTNCSLDNCPLDYCLLDNCPQGQLPPKKIASRAIAPEENAPKEYCPSRIIALWTIAPGLLTPDKYPKDSRPLTIYPWILPPRKTAFRTICRLHNCLSDKWPRGKLPSRKVVSTINYTLDIFSPRITNCSTLTDICFLLFSFFVV